MARRLLALAALAAVLSAAVVPCPPAFAAPAAQMSAAADGGADDAFCRSIPRPPDLVPACPCGCHQRPSAAGTPTGPGFALLPARELPVVPSLTFTYPVLETVAPPEPASAPDPVPLVA